MSVESLFYLDSFTQVQLMIPNNSLSRTVDLYTCGMGNVDIWDQCSTLLLAPIEFKTYSTNTVVNR